MCSTPRISSCAPGIVLARCSRRANALYSTSSISELLPPPLTPVTAVSTPKGIRAVTFCRLFWRAPTISSQSIGTPVKRCQDWPSGANSTRRLVGTGMAFLPPRYGPVTEPRRLAIWPGVPAATIWPPFLPAPGPKSQM